MVYRKLADERPPPDYSRIDMVLIVQYLQGAPTVAHPFKIDVRQIFEKLLEALNETEDLQLIDSPFPLRLTISITIKGYNAIHTILYL